MEELWAPPSAAASGIIRMVCETLMNDVEALVDAFSEAAVAALTEPSLLADASLHAESREFNRSDLVQWLTSNIQQPGARVEPYLGARIATLIDDFVTRGLAPDYAAGWRAALSIAWRYWVRACAELDLEPGLLAEVLEISGHSMVQYALDSVSMLRDASLAAAMNHAGAEAMEMIQLIAGGAAMSEALAEERLGYRLARQHVALVLWVDGVDEGEALDQATAALRSSLDGRQSLVARASSASRWVWCSGDETLLAEDVEAVLSDVPGVRAAIGRPGGGIEGFRSSHQEALAAQAMLARLGSARRLTSYAEVELVDGLTKDRAGAGRFVKNTLGALANADPTLRQALLTYIQCGFNTTRAAARLYLHRNTVERRVSRANELSRVKVEHNPTYVAAALLVLDLVPDLGGSASPLR